MDTRSSHLPYVGSGFKSTRDIPLGHMRIKDPIMPWTIIKAKKYLERLSYNTYSQGGLNPTNGAMEQWSNSEKAKMALFFVLNEFPIH